MSRFAAGVLFAVIPGVALALALLLGGFPFELAVIVGGGISACGFDILFRGRKA
jgi:hypothetical protein